MKTKKAKNQKVVNKKQAELSVEPEKDRQHKRLAFSEKISEHVGYLREQIQLLDALQTAQFTPDSITWTLLEMEKRADEIEKINDAWFNLEKKH